MLRILSFTGGSTATKGYLLIQPSGDAVLVDAPQGVEDWPELQQVRLRALLITHAHFDHVLGANAVALRFQCPIHAFAQPSPEITLEALAAASGIPAQLAPYSVSCLLTESSPLSVAGLDFQLFHVPGHSPDSLCYLPGQPDTAGNRFLLAGDVLFQGSVGRTDFQNGDHELLVNGIREKLYTLPGETVVYPGHGRPTTIGDEKSFNPYVRGD